MEEDFFCRKKRFCFFKVSFTRSESNFKKFKFWGLGELFKNKVRYLRKKLSKKLISEEAKFKIQFRRSIFRKINGLVLAKSIF